MKRDMDLVRKILLKVESFPESLYGAGDFHIEEYDDASVSYHVCLMDEAGLLTAIDASTTSGEEYIPQRLTWAGHEFLDAPRNDNAWAAAKKVCGGVGSLSFEVLKGILVKLGTAAAERFIIQP